MNDRDLQRPVPGDRSPANLVLVFRNFGENEAPQLDARLYAALCPAIAEDQQLLAICSVIPASQPPPNMLFGAVHYLLLEDPDASLRHFYRDLGGSEDPAAAFPEFRTYVLDHRVEIEALLRTRRVQTNVIQRCTVLLPAFAHVAGAASEDALALIEIGPSLGLNLLWDRYAYRYSHAGQDVLRWGDQTSAVDLPAELRGDHHLPDLPSAIPVASRMGIEFDRIDLADDDAIRWLRALIWPEHLERHDRLAAAIEVARHDPPRVIEGDATLELRAALDAAPRDAALCVYATHALYQIAAEGRRRIFDALNAASVGRVVWFASMEGTGGDHSELFLHRYEDGKRTVAHLANCNPHGRWVEWLALN
ncbi:MAG: DUF2332 domain-containing protein [Chloroflexi bacterium]|nr:DUF2332 domain-containing protein [Chloroflexota bacterium]MDA1148182.1 DUF2332 domain-containing protein [Chloroflexota bacterium]